MTDDEILAIKWVDVKGGRISVHEIWKDQVLYAAWPDDGDGCLFLRMAKDTFIKAWHAHASP